MASCGLHDCHRETVDAGSALSVGDKSNNAFRWTHGNPCAADRGGPPLPTRAVQTLERRPPGRMVRYFNGQSLRRDIASIIRSNDRALPVDPWFPERGRARHPQPSRTRFHHRCTIPRIENPCSMISSSQFSSGSPEGEQFTFVTHHPDMRLVRGALRARARSIAIANEVTRLIRIEQQGFSENDSSRSSKKSWYHRSRIRCHGEIRCWWNDARPPGGVRPDGRYTGLHPPQHSQDLTLDLPTLRIATLHSRR